MCRCHSISPVLIFDSLDGEFINLILLILLYEVGDKYDGASWKEVQGYAADA